MKGFPHKGFAKGWYQMAWSHEVPTGTVAPLKYFDRDLVIYRDDSGTVRIADAHCPHMGAHIGYGGKVEGECVRCPYHGWTFGPDGRNMEIPYSEPDRMNVRLRTWDVREVEGLVLAWYGPDAPEFEPLRFTDVDVECWDFRDGGMRLWPAVQMVPQVFTENLADPAHFRYVHSADVVPDLVDFRYDSPHLRTRVAFEFGTGHASTWATPNGPVQGEITLRAAGVGMSLGTLYGFDTVWALQCTTPIDHDTADSRATVWVPKLRSDGSALTRDIRDRWYSQQLEQHQADLDIFEHLQYRPKPPLTKVEQQPMTMLREWARGLYFEPVETTA